MAPREAFARRLEELEMAPRQNSETAFPFTTPARTGGSNRFPPGTQTTTQTASCVTHIGLLSRNAFLAAGLRAIVTGTEEFCLDDTHGDLASLAASGTSPDILLVDVLDGLSLSDLVQIRHLLPKARILLWGCCISPELAAQAIRLGAAGALHMSDSYVEQLEQLRQTVRGEICVDQETAARMVLLQQVGLSRREGQIVQLLMAGKKNKEIAWDLHLTTGTVRVYLHHIFRKTGSKDRWELALWGQRNLVLPAGDTWGPESGKNFEMKLLLVPSSAEYIGRAAPHCAKAAYKSR